MDQHIKNVTPIYKDLLVPVRKHKKSTGAVMHGAKKGGIRNENIELKKQVNRDNATEDALTMANKALIRSTSKTKITGNFKRIH